MSIAEFSAIMQNQAYKNWFKSSSKNIAKQTSTELRNTEESSNRNSFLVTRKTIEQVISKLTGTNATQDQIDTVFKDLKNVKLNRVGRQGITNSDGSLLFSAINFNKISDIITKGFRSIVTDKKVSEFFERGHVYGIPTQLGKRTLEGLSKSAIPEEMKNTLILMLGQLVTELEEQDELTSNLGSGTNTLYARYAKNTNKYLVELQLKETNQLAGRSVAPITNAIRRYFNPNNYTVIAKNLRNNPEDAFIKQLLETHGSPSYIDLISASIASTIAGKQQDKKTYIVPKTKVASTSVKYTTTKLLADSKKEQGKLKALIARVKSIPTVEAKESSINLLALMQARINKQVEQNMGTGSAKNVLNNRTGRFAKSVSIEKLSISREGMISVFYKYMRNPYGTFSNGGNQEFPKTRDPKLLISKSIREIGISLVSNKMRAVLQ